MRERKKERERESQQAGPNHIYQVNISNIYVHHIYGVIYSNILTYIRNVYIYGVIYSNMYVHHIYLQ